MWTNEILELLKSKANPDNASSQRRFGIQGKHLLGIAIPELRKLARTLGKNHLLALELWETGIHEVRILSCLIDNPKELTDDQMERWVKDFDSWDICDQCCGNLFRKSNMAYAKVEQWSSRPEEFVKRSAFTLMACLAVHDKISNDATFQNFLPIIQRESSDERNFVKKAVNWALRQIGKRNLSLNQIAIDLARDIHSLNSKSARWIATDALRELNSQKVQQKLTQ